MGRPLGTRSLVAARKVRIVALAAIAGGGLLLGSGTAAAQDGSDDIDVVRTHSGEDGACLPARAALSHETIHDESTYTLRIHVAAPLCTPVDAVAAIYSMPGNGAAWPQRLSQTESFTLEEAGQVDVVFTKTCEPVQFDVVTGATPAIISPLGEHHGPLLFSEDTSTSHQHFGSACPAPATTSTAPPASVAPPTSDAPPEVEAVTTSSMPAAGVGGIDEPLPPADEPLVLAAGQEPEREALAFAGANVWSLLFAGVALAAAGGSLLSLRRARRSA